jgi:hypothetical protein
VRNSLVAIAFTATLALVGTIAWKAEAVPLAATPAEASKPVIPAACGGGGRHCPPGYHWVCGPNRCWCAPC